MFNPKKKNWKCFPYLNIFLCVVCSLEGSLGGNDIHLVWCIYYSLTNNFIKATEGERTPFVHLKMTHRLSSTLNDRPFPIADESQVELHNDIKSSNITQHPQETRKFRLIFLPFVGNIKKIHLSVSSHLGSVASHIYILLLPL